MLRNLLLAFWIFLPAGIANLTPVLANKVPLLNRWRTPLDFGKKLGGVRLFGDNKTWRGLVSGTLVAGFVAAIEYHAFYGGGFSTLFFIYGVLLGFGALAGDAFESFLKRRAGVDPGKPWFPFDQIDYILCALAFTYPLFHLPLIIMAYILALYFGLHLLISYIAYLLKLKARPI